MKYKGKRRARPVNERQRLSGGAEATGRRGGRFACSGRRLPEKWAGDCRDGLGGPGARLVVNPCRAMSAWTFRDHIAFISFVSSLHPLEFISPVMGALGATKYKSPATTTPGHAGRAVIMERAILRLHRRRREPAGQRGLSDDNRSPAGPTEAAMKIDLVPLLQISVTLFAMPVRTSVSRRTCGHFAALTARCPCRRLVAMNPMGKTQCGLLDDYLRWPRSPSRPCAIATGLGRRTSPRRGSGSSGW